MDLPDWWQSKVPYRIMDCLRGMGHIPNDSIDLIVTDPPYGINETNEKNMSRESLCKPTDYGHYEWDKERIDKEFFTEMFRISKHQIIFGGNYYTDYLKPSSSWIVWDKDNGNNDFADCELAWTSHKTTVRKFKWRWHGMLQENMSNKEKRVHPTQKPIELFKWIINKYSKPNDIIFDPFLGSGTTIRACKELDRIGIGIELNRAYEPAIKERIIFHKARNLEDFF